MPTYQYLVLHKSCGNRVGVAACQAAHAAAESVRTVPVPEGTHVVLLVADSSAELLELSEELKRANIHHVLVREPDPPYSGAPTALGVEPMDRERVRPFMRKFGVLK